MVEMENKKRKLHPFASIAWLGHALDLVGPGHDPSVDSLGLASLMRRAKTETTSRPTDGGDARRLQGISPRGTPRIVLATAACRAAAVQSGRNAP
jgi:hypothetical protein